jgi:alkylhydroperoxidase/carboxymuconolactone decarboxylase family protein YurZ
MLPMDAIAHPLKNGQAMDQTPKPPETYQSFVQRYPQIGQAWELIAKAGQQGPLDAKTARLIKLGIAVGAMREGAIHSGVRKAQAMGISRAEIEQVIALAASTLGLPSTVAIYSWIEDTLAESKP